MECEICGSGPLTDGKPIYRNGPMGQKVPWRCINHLDPEYMPEPETKLLCETIAKGNQDERNKH